jgi:hypothetical protein
MGKIDFFQKKYPKFIYQNYSQKISGRNLEIFFDFKIEPSINFKPKIIIENIDKKGLASVGDRVVNNLVFHLGLIELLSYWKATCSPEIEIQAGELNQEQIRWWKDLIMRGMGQFFYENKIDFRKPKFVEITSPRSKRYKKSAIAEKLLFLENGTLVPIGGGKDSVTTLELLKRVGKKITCFSLNPTDAAKKIMKIARLSSPGAKATARQAGCQEPIIVKRKIDERLLELNRKGFLNGHTPFSAYLAFLSVLLAVIFGQKYIAFSNERSANEGNLKYLGKTINHQYSKSFEFEKKFRDYSKKYLANNIEYFSFLRPLYEIQIAKLFSKVPQYFNAFLSCNEAYKTNSGKKLTTKKWCGNCPKCLFVFVSLYPFMGEKIIKVFGKNLFGDKKLIPLMLQLIGQEKFKPFECVGAKKENLVAFYLSFKKWVARSSANLPHLLKYFKEKILPISSHLENKSRQIMNSWDREHHLPKKFEETLKVNYEFRECRHLLKGNLCRQ